MLAIVGFVVANPYIYYDYLVGAFFAYGLAAVVLLQITAKPPLWDYLATVVIGAAFFALDGYVLRYTITVRVLFSFFGLASLLMLCLRTVWTDRTRFRLCFLPALLLVAGMGLDGYFLEHSSGVRSGTLDLYLYSADCSFGLQTSYLVGQLFYRVRWLFELSLVVYETCMVPLVLVYAVMLATERRRALVALLAFAIAGPLAIVCFLLVPGTGPVYTFRHFPTLPLPTASVARLALEPILVNAPRNAIPSLHFTWALLAYWNTRRGPRWLRVLTLVLLADTFLATLGTGQHYLVDLIAAVPFALGVQAIAERILHAKGLPWRIAVLIGFGLLAAWLAVVRYAVPVLWTSPAVPWSFLVATSALTTVGYFKLRRSEEPSFNPGS